MIPFHPLIQPKNALTGVQKYLLRVIFGWAGKTVLHRERLVEILETHNSIRQLLPLAEPDRSESNTELFWAPRTESDRKRFNLERRNRSRHRQTIGISWGESRPSATQSDNVFSVRKVNLRSRFPSPSHLRYLIAELGYDPDAALAAFAQPRKIHGRPDRRRKKAVPGADEQAEQAERKINERPKINRDYQRLDYGYNLYVPEAPTRRTLTGGGFTKNQVSQGLSKMRTDTLTKAALVEIVYRRQSTLEVSNKSGIPVEKLYVYASRLREHIRQESQAVAA
jgi:hypothetical protein